MRNPQIEEEKAGCAAEGRSPREPGDARILDIQTRRLYREFMERLAEDKTTDTRLRDPLIRSLHFKYEFSLPDLASMFSLSRRRLNDILRNLERGQPSFLAKDLQRRAALT